MVMTNLPPAGTEEASLVRELRKQLQEMHAENAELRQQIAWRDRWIKELRDTVDAFLRPKPNGDFTPGAQNDGTSYSRKST
jgi:hypothetical protein